ncbi:uncharacterized protein LOC131663300 [Phymastichus coffea]|uniref:uncharacterized protein LOC131663300 n=1 Tax=Phymastichus coffea TaxID=108790 RepID=UPI00273C5DB7|nr:uncharacterized protein LOC131663300 [Phymastichus coffea]
MSARVMNPALMTEMSSKLSVVVASSQASGSAGQPSVGRVAPSRAALARVRRDLFGPVDHAAARAYAEHELRTQSLLDSERWGFDFRLELPKSEANSRFVWQPVTTEDLVPEPYALRGMPYLRRQSPAAPSKSAHRSPRPARSCESSPVAVANSALMLLESGESPSPTGGQLKMQLAERTPPQESRVPLGGEKTPDVVPAIAELTVRSTPAQAQPTTPALSTRKQAAITDFMKSRKRTLNATAKSMLEPAEKLPRNAGQIHS